jgi:hypothetical protein
MAHLDIPRHVIPLQMPLGQPRKKTARSAQRPAASSRPGFAIELEAAWLHLTPPPCPLEAAGICERTAMSFAQSPPSEVG